jgi:DNA repair protein RadD
MMRPTMSPGLYLQQAGRGLRLKSHTDHCLVLDFAGVVEQHGPITAVKIPRKQGEGDGIAPAKICPNCDSIIAAGCRTCPDCGYEYPAEEKIEELDLHLRDVDIMGKEAMRLECGGWFWQMHTGKTSGKQMLMVEYMGVNISDRSIKEYILIFHDGYPGYKAAETMKAICTNAGIDWAKHENTDTLLEDLNYNGQHPAEVFYRKDGKFYKVVERNWTNPGQKREVFDDDLPF